MQVVSSYGAEIKNKNIPIRHTLALYREAVRCLTEIYETVWTELSMIDQIKRRFNEAEHLVHETKKNHARFDFDARFPKMPSYLRRAAIQHALGSVSSYHTRLEQWKMERFPENRSLYMKTMRCRYFIGMSCTNQEKRVKTRPA